MKRVKFTTNLNEELLKQIKVYAIQNNVNVNDIIEQLFFRMLEKTANA